MAARRIESDSDSESEYSPKKIRRRIANSLSSDEDDVDPQPSTSYKSLQRGEKSKNKSYGYDINPIKPPKRGQTKNKSNLKDKIGEYHEKKHKSKDVRTDSSSLFEEDETWPFIAMTEVFKCETDGICRLPGCFKSFTRNETEVHGVKLLNRQTRKYEGSKTSGSGYYYICADHECNPNYESDDSETEDSSDLEDFIDDREEVEEEDLPGFIDDTEVSAENGGARDELDSLTRKLARRTLKDKENIDRYLNEQAKYQLEVHSASNRSLQVDPEQRFKRNVRGSKGLRDERRLQKDEENKETETIFVYGEKVDVIIESQRKSKNKNYCAIEKCDIQFVEGRTQVVKAFLREDHESASLQKPKWICYQHFEQQQNLECEESDDSTDEDVREKKRAYSSSSSSEESPYSNTDENYFTDESETDQAESSDSDSEDSSLNQD